MSRSTVVLESGGGAVLPELQTVGSSVSELYRHISEALNIYIHLHIVYFSICRLHLYFVKLYDLEL